MKFTLHNLRNMYNELTAAEQRMSRNLEILSQAIQDAESEVGSSDESIEIDLDEKLTTEEGTLFPILQEGDEVQLMPDTPDRKYIVKEVSNTTVGTQICKIYSESDGIIIEGVNNQYLIKLYASK